MKIDFYSNQAKEISVSRREMKSTEGDVSRGMASRLVKEELRGSREPFGENQAHEDIDEELQDDCTAAVEQHIGGDAGAIRQE